MKSPSGNMDRSAQGPPAQLSRGLKQAVRMIWDRLGLVIGVSMTTAALLLIPPSLIGFLPHSTPFLLRLGIGLLISAPMLFVFTSSACRIVHRIDAREEVSYLDLWRGALELLGPALRLGLFDLLIASVLAVNLWFYLRLGGIFGIATALVCSYALLFFGMMAVYHAPLLAAQEMGLFDEPERRARRGALAVLRRAFFLALGSPLYSAGLFLTALALTLALLWKYLLVLLPLFWLGALAILTTLATRLLLVQYDVLPPPPPEEEVVPDEKFRIR